jgi:hypothetical protein
MSEQQKIDLFSAWIAGELTPVQQQQFEQCCIEDTDFAAKVEKASHIGVTAASANSFPLPQWDKEATFSAPKSTPWWQWQGLSAASFACSAFAIFLVVSGFNLNVSDGRISMGFGDNMSEQQINQLVQQRLDDYQESNQAMFTQYVDAIQTQQRESSAQLTEYLLASSRQERREDFAELIKFINEQRSDDQVFYARQLNNLQQEIYAQGGSRTGIPSMEPINTQLPNE